MLVFAVSISVNAFSLHFRKCRYFACELLWFCCSIEIWLYLVWTSECSRKLEAGLLIFLSCLGFLLPEKGIRAVVFSSHQKAFIFGVRGFGSFSSLRKLCWICPRLNKRGIYMCSYVLAICCSILLFLFKSYDKIKSFCFDGLLVDYISNQLHTYIT